MRKATPTVLASGILFLFFIQMAGTLVESIYVLDLMNTSLDEKVLGLLFFFTPILLLSFRKKLPVQPAWILFDLLFLVRGITPYLDTQGRMWTSGLGTGSALLLFALLLTARPKGSDQPGSATSIAAGLALAVGFSVLLRTVNYSLDYSLTAEGSWTGWGLGLLLGWTLTGLEWESPPAVQAKGRRLASALLGIFLVLTLVYFAFSAPAVIARWTGGNYPLIVSTVSLLSAGWAWLAFYRPHWFERVSPLWLLLWNLAFTLCLTATILAQRVPFPQTPGSSPVVVGEPTWLQFIPLVLMLLLFPVIFLDLRLLLKQVQQANPSPGRLVPGMLLGSLVLISLVFISIFTNVWGYIEPVSPPFRNLFGLPYLLAAGTLTLLVYRRNRLEPGPGPEISQTIRWAWTIFLAALFLGTAAGALATEPVRPGSPDKTSLLVMTYNIQQANDGSSQRSYERQLALIRKVSPDVLALQESDSARIALNNNDYARYYAGKLGYYSYYGPTTVTGTFGTALLSKYPLLNLRSVFTYSDLDEIGTSEAEIEVGSRRFTIYNVHPDGSDTAMLAWAESILARSQGKPNLIILGDFNLRDYETAYQRIAGAYTNAWTSVYPSKIGGGGTDMSGENRIDHIFISPSLQVRLPIYLLPPESATDHPTHWAEVFWDK